MAPIIAAMQSGAARSGLCSRAKEEESLVRPNPDACFNQTTAIARRIGTASVAAGRPRNAWRPAPKRTPDIEFTASAVNLAARAIDGIFRNGF